MRRGGGARLVGEHQVEGVDRRLAGVDRREVLLEHVAGGAGAGADGGGDVDRRHHSASPMIGGTRKRPSTASGAAASTSSRSSPGWTTSSRSTLRSGYGCVIGATVGELELVDVGEVVEHGAELRRRAVDLVVGQRQPGQPGDVDHVGGRDAVGHAARLRGPMASGASRRRWAARRRPLGPAGSPVRVLSGAMATVTFAGATRTYAGLEHPAVDHLDLEIADGEFLVLVGPSGCGKSTTLRMLAGLEPVDEGTIHIGDRDVTDVAPKDRDIAMVFQSYALYPHMTVAENIGFHLKVKRVPQGRAGRAGPRGRRASSTSSRSSTASRPSCRAASASGWRWAGRSSASRRCS